MIDIKSIPLLQPPVIVFLTVECVIRVLVYQIYLIAMRGEFLKILYDSRINNVVTILLP